MAITPGLVKGPANNWVPVTKSLLHALIPMASPFPTPGPESLGQRFAWDVVCASQRWEMSLKSQLSDHSPAFSSMTDTHPLSDLAGSQMPPDFPWLAPHAPMLKSSGTKLPGLWKSDCPCERITPSDTPSCLHVWTSSPGCGSEPIPVCLLWGSLFLGVWCCQELQEYSHWSGQIQTTLLCQFSLPRKKSFR